MGASHSAATAQTKSPREVYKQLTNSVVSQFDTLELQTIRKTFKQLETPVADLSIWTEDTFVKFLEVPGRVGSLLFLSATYAASFPLTENSPTVLEYDALLRAIAIFTGRTDGIITQSAKFQLLFDSFAVIADPMRTGVKGEAETIGERKPATSASVSEATTDKTIRIEDLIDLIQFCLSIQEKRDVEVVSHYIENFQGSKATQLHETARAIAGSISPSQNVSSGELTNFMKTSPYLFDALSTLYAHFLYPGASRTETTRSSRRSFKSGNILNECTLAQLGVFLPRELLFGKVDALYMASHDGFSMASFESKVLRYPGPTVLLLEGNDLVTKTVVKYGFFSTNPWKHSSKETFGDSSTTLFQLFPHHKVHTGGTLTHKIWFAKTLGIGIGCLPPASHNKSHDFGDLSLVMDTSLEFADIRDNGSVAKCEIREVEVWGLGGDREAQRKAWEWEENEAQRRRTINVKDMQADYDLLEMAGLVGQNRSGGSV